MPTAEVRDHLAAHAVSDALKKFKGLGELFNIEELMLSELTSDLIGDPLAREEASHRGVWPHLSASHRSHMRVVELAISPKSRPLKVGPRLDPWWAISSSAQVLWALSELVWIWL
jgi:hypothetical protein